MLAGSAGWYRWQTHRDQSSLGRHASAARCRRPIRRPVVDDVGAAPARQLQHTAAQVFRAVVDQMIRAGFPCGGELVGAAGRGNDDGTHRLADLDRRKTRAAARAMHQQHFARLHVGFPFQGAVRRRIERRKIGCLRVGHGLGDRHDVCRRRHRIFGKGALADAGSDPLADREIGDARTELDDVPGHLIAGHIGERRLVLVLALHTEHGGETHAGRAHPQQHFTRLGLRHRHVGDLEIFDRPVSLTNQRPHSLPLELAGPTFTLGEARRAFLRFLPRAASDNSISRRTAEAWSRSKLS